MVRLIQQEHFGQGSEKIFLVCEIWVCWVKTITLLIVSIPNAASLIISSPPVWNVLLVDAVIKFKLLVASSLEENGGNKTKPTCY